MIYGYARVSTDQQVDKESLGVQERTVRGQAMILGQDDIALFVERGVSGAMPLASRPEGKKLIAGLIAGDIVVVAKFDRMFRNARDALNTLHDLEARKVTLHVMDLGGDVVNAGFGKVMFTILAAVSEMARDQIRENVRTTKRDQKARGMYLGGVIPWGHQVLESGKLAVLPGYEDALAFMKATRQSHSLRATADAMKKYGFKISHEKVRQVLEAA